MVLQLLVCAIAATSNSGAKGGNYGPFKLSDGHTVQLAFVDTGGEKPWKPDGSPPTAAQCKAAHFLLNWGSSRPEGPRTIFLRVNVDEPRDKEDWVSCLVKVAHKSNWNVWQTYGDSITTLDLASFRAPDPMKTCDMRFGVAHDPFRVFWKGNVGAGVFKPIAAKPAEPSDVEGGPVLTAAVTIHIPSSLKGKEVQITAFGIRGQAFYPIEMSNDPILTQDPPSSTRSFSFAKCRPEDIKSVEVRVRDYEWFTFRNIHLYPNTEK